MPPLWQAGVPLWPGKAQPRGKGDDRLWGRLRIRRGGRECVTAGSGALSLGAQGLYPSREPLGAGTGALSLVLESAACSGLQFHH